MKIYVIPDIHGMLNELKNTMLFFYEDFKSDDSKLVFLGDYIHGGDDSVGVVNYIISLQENMVETRWLHCSETMKSLS